MQRRAAKDPITGAELLQTTWKYIRLLAAAPETAQAEAHFYFVPAAHPARIGRLPTLFFAPRAFMKLHRHARWLSEMAPEERARALRDIPGLRPFLKETESGVRLLMRLPRLIAATHHQKIAVFDRRVVAMGGLDLKERRWDTQKHTRAAGETWHNVHLVFGSPVIAQAVALPNLARRNGMREVFTNIPIVRRVRAPDNLTLR